jgi:hypothetical protein
MNQQEVRDYWRKLSTEANLSSEAMAAVDGVLSSEEHLKVFQSGFVPRSESSRALSAKSEEVEKYQKQYDEALNKVHEWNKWAEETAVPTNERILAQLEQEQKLKKIADDKTAAYHSIYGDLDGSELPGNSNSTPANGNNGEYLTRAEYDELSRQSMTSLLDINTELVNLAFEHQSKLGKPLDIAAFRAKAESDFASAQRAGTSTTLRAVYQNFAGEDLSRLAQDEFDSKVKEAADKRVEEQMKKISRSGFPVDSAPDEMTMNLNISPNAQLDGDSSDADAKEEFVKAWHETPRNPGGSPTQA